MIRSRGLRWIAVPLTALALLTAACGDDSDKDDNASSTTEATVAVPDGIVVGAGVNDPADANIAVLEFLPAKVTVEAGTDITWEWSGTEPHSVTFVPEGQEAPDVEADPNAGGPIPATGPIDGKTLVSSGLQPFGAAATPFTASFATAGTYPYICIIHPGMTGEVEVVEAGGDADSPADVAEARASDTKEYLAEGQAAKADLLAAGPSKEDNGDGTSTWTVEMGTTTEHTDILAFSPTPADVKAGDTVTFVNNSKAPHTASFFGTGAEPIQDPFDPKAQAPSGDSPQTLAAAGFFNTGLLPPDVGPPPEARTFSFVVPTPGTYAYVCIFHAPSEMTGTIKAT